MDAPEACSDRSRTRRGLLRVAGTVGAFLLAGCTQDVGEELPPNEEWLVSEYLPALPVEERYATMADHIEAAADADIEAPEELPDAVPDDLDVTDVEEKSDGLHLEYASSDRYRTGDLHHVASLAGAYAALVEAGYDAVKLSISIVGDAPDSYGHATVEAPWAVAYVADELTATEYAEHVAGTVETRREDPEDGVTPEK